MLVYVKIVWFLIFEKTSQISENDLKVKFVSYD